MSYIKILLVLLACFSVHNTLFSQSNFEGLGESSFAVNADLSSIYKVNFAIRSRYYLYQYEDFNFENRQLDFVHFSTLNLDYNHSVSLGIQYRIRESIDGGSNELRLTQQFNYTKKQEAIRFGHRLRFEQRILEDLTILRSRYRFALDFPLNGEKLDIGEAYFVGSMEGLLSNSKNEKPEIDHRTTAHLGWLVSKPLKLQLGMEYRFEALNLKTEQRLFLLTSAILKI
ncbi:hypothetical protein BWZ20_07465 [Winogradskyella sp. J14-2]|uniref:DUF2490 domain-containing protein n=1 Tax=Winogradskyella sp. J14-2 TaxID=1936080 RepID=UPI000972A446|nr:DUF2490 domain-containing protein [Winogradskyella sp. J14-2]APY08147.1 hypothetical protein BWZ20_07465 [Winogradskyella sp. J14-2]